MNEQARRTIASYTTYQEAERAPSITFPIRAFP